MPCTGTSRGFPSPTQTESDEARDNGESNEGNQDDNGRVQYPGCYPDASKGIFPRSFEPDFQRRDVFFHKLQAERDLPCGHRDTGYSSKSYHSEGQQAVPADFPQVRQPECCCAGKCLRDKGGEGLCQGASRAEQAGQGCFESVPAEREGRGHYGSQRAGDESRGLRVHHFTVLVWSALHSGREPYDRPADISVLLRYDGASVSDDALDDIRSADPERGQREENCPGD